MRYFLLGCLPVLSACLVENALGSPPQPQEGSSLPQEVVVKGADVDRRVKLRKTPLNIQVDPYETVRTKQRPPLYILLPELPFSVDWRGSYPDFLSNPRVLEAWRSVFPKRQGVVFYVREKLEDALQRPLESNEAKYCQWSLNIVDENGDIFEYFTGETGAAPPKEFFWNGRNDRGDWIQVGHTYSPVYKFTGPEGSQYTAEGSLIRFDNFAHPESDGIHLSLASESLFGPKKSLREVEPDGVELLHATVDYIKLHDDEMLSGIRVFASTNEIAKAQAASVLGFLARELAMDSHDVTVYLAAANSSDQRVEITLRNRPTDKTRPHLKDIPKPPNPPAKNPPHH